MELIDRFYTFFNPPKSRLEGHFDASLTRQEGYRSTEAIVQSFLRAGMVLEAVQNGNYDFNFGEDALDDEMTAPNCRFRGYDEIDLQAELEALKAKTKK